MAEAQAKATIKVNISGGNLLSPGFIMIIIAVIIDVLDFLTLSFFIMDIIALMTICVWMYFHSQQVSVKSGAAARLGKWQKSLKWIRPLFLVLEFIPIVGMLPCWTILVYLELQNGN